MKNFTNEAEELCKTCGLCCQGVFHTYAYIYSEEDKHFAKEMKSEIYYLADDKLDAFALPCPVFDKICTVYSMRPSVCKKHECDLLKNYKNQKISSDKTMDVVNKMQNVLKPLLPGLKQTSNDFSSNNPEFLRKIIIESFPGETMSKSFKNKHKKMLMNYAVFLYLKETYFYIPLGSIAKI